MKRKHIQFDKILDTEDGRRFIYDAVKFFVDRATEKVKDSLFRPLEQVPVKAYYEKYKFIYDKSKVITMNLCYLLVETAAVFIDRAESVLSPDLVFPFDCDVMFDLQSWFEEIDTKNLYTKEILILLINKLYKSPYRFLI